ncbi:MAG: hypothetical protein PUD24_05165 [Oscillospiraceae bacterium]|nr:hypothetical protein [Oscillospiraceae bacterium]
MKLYIKRDIHSCNSRFIVLDELCHEKYTVFSSGKSFEKLKISDLSGNVKTKINRLPLPLLHAYSISSGKTNIKFILNPAKNAQNCYYYGISWHIRGQVFLKSFDILDVDNSVIAVLSRCFESCVDGYALTIYSEEYEQLCLASAVCANLASLSDNPALQTV